MSTFLDNIITLIVLSAWIFGVILAKGFLSTFAAICIPPWAWYLTIEHFAKFFSLI